MPPSPQTAKLTSTLHLLIPRLRLLQKKSTASSVVQRRELSHLLSEGRDASARIRVENVITTDIAVEVMEMVELYCELLLARANVLDQLAFGEKGVQARNHARDVAAALKRETLTTSSNPNLSLNSHGKPPGGGGGSGGGLFSKFNPFSSSPSPSPSQSQSQSQSHPQPQFPSTTDEPATGTGTGTGTIETPYLDPALDEASSAIFYAWSRFPSDVRELTILRGLLADRYGKDFMALAQDNKFPEADGLRVPERLVKGLRVRPPTPELVDSYLREIARAYGVSWGEEIDAGGVEEEVPPAYDSEGVDGVGHAGEDDKDGGEGGDGDVVDGGIQIPSTPTAKPSAVRKSSTSDPAELNRATPPRGPLLQSGKSPVSVAPPGPRSDNPNPRVKVPGGRNGGNGGANEAGEADTAAAAPAKAKSGGIPELDELTRRFAALRK